MGSRLVPNESFIVCLCDSYSYVVGGGTAAGMIADLLASGMNMNCGGRDHIGIALEQQITLWAREWFQFPNTSNGVFVTGTYELHCSISTVTCVWLSDHIAILYYDWQGLLKLISWDY